MAIRRGASSNNRNSRSVQGGSEGHPNEKPLAHISEDGREHLLYDHLTGTAKLAADFASEFGCQEWGYLAGLWHDLGKYSREFQEYILASSGLDVHIETIPGHPDHSSAGAQHATRSLPILGHLMAYVVAGHHSGLLNGRDTGSCQEARLNKTVPPWKHGLQFLPTFASIEPPTFLRNALASRDAFAMALFIRMIFSCLVDADFLNTESFMNPQQSDRRVNWPDKILEQMDKNLTSFVEGLNPVNTFVNQQRAFVREACLKAAMRNPGLFSLTVPTGGGKTLASLAFALRHALQHGLKRIVYIVPLTSIIEQNAEIFRKVFQSISENLGFDIVLEHHSNFDPEKETPVSRLAAENWNAPVVVTTSVQFYESLFANKTSRCRKLHNLASSVIILDEAQTLPVSYLKPCLRVLKELADNYRSSIVICTATQPAIDRREDFEIGIEKPFEIMPDPVELYNRLQRVHIEYIGKQNDNELFERIMSISQALCIVNTRSHARRLFDTIGQDDGHFHLSGNMCPAHRSFKLSQIREYLAECRICRLISTQVVEAGVDVDFPVVFRSLAGLDSIAQAAGRCNRNGKLTEKGRTYVFRSEHSRAERFFADTAQCAGQILSLYSDPLDLKAIEHYFKLYYWDQSERWDEKRIMENFRLNNEREFPFNFNFKQAAMDLNLMDDTDLFPIIIPWGEEGQKLCKQLRAMPEPNLEIRRKLQRFVVQIHRKEFGRHSRNIQLAHDGIFILACPEIHYSEDVGLNLDATGPGAFFG